MKRPPATLEIGEALGRGHAHLEQEEAEHGVEDVDEELVFVRQVRARAAGDVADEGAAEEQEEAWVEEDLAQDLRIEELLRLTLGRVVGVVAELAGHVAVGVHAVLPHPSDEEERHEAARDLHDREHGGHVGSERDVRSRDDAECRGERAGAVRAVVAAHHRGVDFSQLRERPEDEVGGEADGQVDDEAEAHEPDGVDELVAAQMGELFTAVPTDRDQQVERDRLVERLRKLEGDLEYWNQEPHEEEKQQRLQHVVLDVEQDLM